MPKQVTTAASNRYCQARLRAAKYNDDFASRAKAVEHLPGVTEDSLKKYELDINRPPNIVVALMADAYNEPELRAWYCSNECPLGKDCRVIEEMPAERTLIRLQNVKSTKATKGMSVAAILKDILSKTLQPTITGQPSIPSFTLTGAKAVEAGTAVNPAQYSAATLNKGSYKYGPSDTGVTATNWKVERITNTGTIQVASVDAASLAAGSDDNDGNGFIIGDDGGDNVVSSLKYKVTATHGAGVTAKDNLGSDSNPVVAIAAGSKTKETSAYSPFRNYFYGATAAKPALDSAYVRGLTKSGKAYAAGTITINVAAGTQRIAVACINGKTGVTKVINETAMNADVTATFTKNAGIAVEGANGYSAKDYNVWVYEPAKPYENACVLKVTLG